MALADKAVSSAQAQAVRPAIVRYEGKLIEHVFMTRPTKLADGTYSKRAPTGQVALVYRICPVLADGSLTTSGAIWLWLEPARDKSAAPKLDPTLLRAFYDSLKGMRDGIDATDAEGITSGDWLARPKKAAAAEPTPPAPALKGIAALAAKAAKQAAEADGAQSVDLDAAVSDLPF